MRSTKLIGFQLTININHVYNRSQAGINRTPTSPHPRGGAHLGWAYLVRKACCFVLLDTAVVVVVVALCYYCCAGVLSVVGGDLGVFLCRDDGPGVMIVQRHHSLFAAACSSK